LRITAEGVSKRFNREWILKKFSYDFSSGTRYAVTGPNGSGKSTLLSIISGQMPVSEGVVRYSSHAGEIPVEEIYKHMAIAAPYMDLIEELTLEEHLHFHFKLKPPRTGLSVSEALSLMYLENAKNKLLRNFSSGMKQRVRLALAFYSLCDIVILDEPATNLDNQAYNWYKSELKKLPEDCLVIIASNNPLEYPENSEILDLQKFRTDYADQ
jgi:ABC-type multidrug transport system ATPase subunit